ncbi:MAG: MATE family efflux transporter [Ruminococcaceae bacterium]|nr:MATE family efflux transporter [Oscillospiraceae bacterium]
MNIQLSDHFSYRRLLRFTLPSVVMMIFTSVYGVVDGLFVSNFVGQTPFAAVNFITPFLMMLGAIGFMLGTGGSALISKTLGMGDNDKAQRLFSMFVYIAFILGIVLSAVGIRCLRPVAALLGAQGQLLEDCVAYGRIILLALPFLLLQFEFQSFFITAEKPQLGLVSTVIAGVTNMILDALLTAVFPLGLAGAAIATASSQCIGGILPLLYFSRKNNSLLRLRRPQLDGKAFLKACTNGSSELLSNISMSLVAMLYNTQLLHYAGENGVAAYGVLMYINFVFLSVFIGYSVGVSPVIGYHFGAKNHSELRNLRRKSLTVILVSAVTMFALSQLLAVPLSRVFVGYSDELYRMTVRGFRLFSFSFLFAGISIFGSAFFTALNNGLISAVIAFLRTLVFEVSAVLLLPLIWDLDGIWASVTVAELASAVITVICLIAKKKHYQY